MNVPELHRLIRQRQLPPGVAATHLSVSIDTIRVTLEEHPAPRQPRRLPTPSTTVRRAGPAYQMASIALPRSRFVDLYEHQHASLRDIAATIGVSKQTVTELARDYRIPLRRPQSPQKYTFDRDWLYREHVTKGRPLAELAREHGVSATTMTNLNFSRDLFGWDVVRAGRRVGLIVPDRHGRSAGVARGRAFHGRWVLGSGGG